MVLSMKPLLVTLQRGMYYCERRQLLAGRIGVGSTIEEAIRDYCKKTRELFPTEYEFREINPIDREDKNVL